MDIIKTISSNPLVKNMLMGQLKKVFVEHGVTAIIVTCDEKQELQFDVKQEGIVTMTIAEYSELHKAALDGLK